MKNLIVVIVAVTFCISCSNSTEPETADVAQPSPDIGLSFVDEDGKDLLNPEHPNHWNEDNLDVYYLQDGEKVRVYDDMMDYPESFKIFYAGDQDRYTMQLWTSSYVEDGHTTTFIEFPDGKMDTIKIKVHSVEGSLLAQKIWYNGELSWQQPESGQPEARYFVRTKIR